MTRTTFKAVLSGSYHRQPVQLAKVFRELEVTGCRILSPLSITFTNESDAVLKTAAESNLQFTPAELEKYHLRAIAEADFVWLYAPDGYIGLSAAFEIGYGVAIGKPIFTNHSLQDEMLRSQVHQVPSVFEAIELLP